jgi:hypothetical protein
MVTGLDGVGRSQKAECHPKAPRFDQPGAGFRCREFQAAGDPWFRLNRGSAQTDNLYGRRSTFDCLSSVRDE